MYNILLTDDEQIVIDTLTIILNRNFGDDVKIYSALSGVKALDIIKQEKIDIIFMDMHMPGINGLETIGLIKQINPNIVIVILSAYDQFQYAQEAMNLGVFKYLTKPVNRNIIISTVRNCMNQVDSQLGELSNKLEMHEKLNLVSSIVESDFIYSCVFGDTTTDFSSYLEYFEIENVSFFMCCFEFSDLQQDKRYDVYVKVRDVLTTKSKCIIGSFMTNRIGVFFPIENFQNDESSTSSNSKSTVDNYQKKMIKDIFSILSTNLTCKIKIGVSQIESDIVKSSAAYNNALTVLNTIDLSSGFAFYSDSSLENYDKEQIKKIESLLLRIENRIKVADAVSVSQLVTEYIDLLYDVYNSKPEILKTYLMEFIFKIRAITIQVLPTYVNSAFDNSFSVVASSIEKKSITQFVLDRALECVTALSGSSSVKTNPSILKLCKYIEKNLSTDISLEQAANYLGVTSFYLSKLFKEETGNNFVSYVTELRLSKAKKLLSDDSLIIKEVTSMVGYNDQNYFSKLFKQKYGVSPTEYRDLILKSKND